MPTYKSLSLLLRMANAASCYHENDQWRQPYVFLGKGLQRCIFPINTENSQAGFWNFLWPDIGPTYSMCVRAEAFSGQSQDPVRTANSPIVRVLSHASHLNPVAAAPSLHFNTRSFILMYSDH